MPHVFPHPKMKTLAYLAWFAASLTIAAVKAQERSTDEQQLIQLAHDWCKAYLQKDAALLDRILATDYTGRGSLGTTATKAEELAGVKASSLEACVNDNINVRVYGTAAVVTGRGTRSGVHNGVPFKNRQVLWTDTYIKRDSRWQCVASQGTIVVQGLNAPAATDKPAAQSTGNLAAGESVKTAGIRMIPIDGGKYRVWTKRVGSGKIKVLLLHGGPGVTHEYLECFEDFLPAAGVEFYYYDQLGSHYSDQPNDPNLWTVERFREELEQVRAALGLENFYLYGQSWGGMLGIEYALKYQQHLKGLILSNMTASIPSYVSYVNELRKKLPAATLAILDKYEAKKDYENPEYQAAMMGEVYARHLCRLSPLPDPVERTFKHINAQVYNTMQGPNEFVITGNFKDWDRWADLPKIKVPTLVIGARHDEMNPEDIKREGRLLPRSRVAICENGSHLAMWDDQQAYFGYLLEFLRDVEPGKF
jgi:proline iminopeptidase